MSMLTQCLTEKEWEHCLQEHYLRSDGPAVDTPLVSIDATPSELRAASGLDDLSSDEIISAFMSIFSREKMRKVPQRIARLSVFMRICI